MLAVLLFASGCSTLAQDGNAEPPVPHDPVVPLWQLPPIATPYFIGWYGAHSPSRPGFGDALLLDTQTMETEALLEDLPWWSGRGVMGCPWAAGTQVDWLSSTDDFVKQFVDKAIAPGLPAICLDEMVGYDTETQNLRESTPGTGKYPGNPKNRELTEACRRIKERYPGLFIAVYSHMQSDAMVEAIKAGWIDLNIVMSYMHGQPAWTERLALWRLGNARKAGVEEKTIPSISLAGAPNDVIDSAWVEKWIKHYREHFPKMPGVFFYPHPYRDGHPEDLAPEKVQLMRDCNRLVREHYIDPAPKVTIAAPADGATVAESVEIRAGADRPVSLWRLYVGSTLVAENDTGLFARDSLPAGMTALTVHAITEEWLRGAAQIQVTVQG